MEKRLQYFPFQLEGIKFLSARKSALLADTMGLGKTAQAIGAIKELGANKVLVVCPASIKYNWKHELKLWGLGHYTVQVVEGRYADIDRSVNVVIINYDLIHSPKIYNQLLDNTFSVGIFDESHYLKGRHTKRTKAVLLRGGIASRCVYKWFMTGTPVLNRPIELFPMLKACCPKVMYPFTSYSTYAKRYCGAYFDGYQTWDRGASNIDELAKKLKDSDFMLRRLKEEVLTELPSKQFQILPVRAGSTSYYEERHFNWDKKEIKKVTLEQVLKNVCDGDLGQLATLRRRLAEDKYPAVKSHLKDLFEVKDKVVVFAHHRSVINQLAEDFKDLQPAVVMGGVTAEKKHEEVQRFQTDPACKLFIGNIQAAGVGITLTASDIAVFAEIDWVPGNIFQAVDRIHRIGQDRGVLIQFLVVEDSLEEYILQAVVSKKDIVEKIVGDKDKNTEPIGFELLK